MTLDDCRKRVLNEHLAGLDPEQRLIFSAVGGGMLIPTNWRKRVWYPLVEAAGLGYMGLHIHDLPAHSLLESAGSRLGGDRGGRASRACLDQDDSRRLRPSTGWPSGRTPRGEGLAAAGAWALGD